MAHTTPHTAGAQENQAQGDKGRQATQAKAPFAVCPLKGVGGLGTWLRRVGCVTSDWHEPGEVSSLFRGWD